MSDPCNARANDNRARTSTEKFAAIDARRKKAGIAIATLCGRAAMAPTTWWRISTGVTAPRAATLRRLKRALDLIVAETIDPDWEA